jgi:hypothetical protein
LRFTDLTADQRRQRIDAVQAFEVWREADREFRHSYRGTMHWQRKPSGEYLARKYAQVWTQVGKRSPQTEKIKADYAAQRTSLRARLTKLEKNLVSMNRVNKAMNLGRMPDIAARVLAKLDEANLLGSHVVVAGTHCLYAYEARAGIFFGGDLTATKDIDFLLDVRQRFTFVMSEVKERGFIGLLKQVDSTFRKLRSYNAANDDPYAVDLIRPLRPREGTNRDPELTLNPGDLQPAAIEGLQWLVNAPKFEETIVGEDGRPGRICCVDPRVFALHKLWLSQREDRRQDSRKRDAMQASAVAIVARDYIGLKFDKRELSMLPKELLDGIDVLLRPIDDRTAKGGRGKKQ